MKRLVLALLMLVGAGVLVGWFVWGEKVSKILSVGDSLEQLRVPPQSPTDKIRIDRVVLSNDGWIVARGIEGERLGQIIEISPFLKAGTHKDVEIPLGEFYNDEELITMMYQDDGDGVFNGLDQPALDENGRFIAAYVRTGQSLPARITEQGSGMVHSMSGMSGVTQVRYTDQGFLPKTIEVPAGTMVEFVNESSTQMWVASDVHPSHEQLPTFDQFNGSAPGTVYNYLFDKSGTWSYHDHLNPEDEAKIIVL